MEIDNNNSLLDLLSHFSSKEDISDTFNRSEIKNYQNCGIRFQFKKKNFAAHYSHLYFSRLCTIRPHIENKFKEMKIGYTRVIDVKNNANATIIGTLYKEMKLKPSILHRINLEQVLGTEKFKDYNSSDDFLYLEDETGRVMLDFSEYGHSNPHASKFHIQEHISERSSLSPLQKSIIVNKEVYTPKELITGMIVGIIGRADSLGHIFVHKIIFPNIPKNPNDIIFKEIMKNKSRINELGNLYDFNYYCSDKAKDANFIAIVSGLNIRYDESQAGIKALIQFLTGISSIPETTELSRKISRLIIAGNSIREERDLLIALQSAYKVQEIYNKIYTEIAKSMATLDTLINDIAKNINIDIMPGEQDPSDAAMPQQALNRAYFPKSYCHSQLNAVTNPYECILDSALILGTSGQNINDIMQFARVSDNPIEILEHSLYWNHIAPSAPDTLKCLPFSDEDPFTVNSLPHIYFAGNMNKFETKLFIDEDGKNVCRLISIPIFSNTQSIVLVNLRNLDTFEIKL